MRTKRLNTRFIIEEDWKSLLEIWVDFNKSEYAKYDVPHTETASEARDKAKFWSGISHMGEHMFFAICLDNNMIGYIDFHKISKGYELGYCFHSDYHGHGYATESIKALMERLSDNQKTLFYARTAINNIPSVKLLNALGFKKSGEEKVSFYKDKDGKDIYFTGGIFVLEMNG